MEVSLGTIGVGNLVLLGVLPGATWVSSFWSENICVPQTQFIFGEDQFSPGDVIITCDHACSLVVTRLPGTPSGQTCSLCKLLLKWLLHRMLY